MEKDEGIENFRAAIMIIQCDSHPYAAIAAPQIMWLLAVVLLCAGICSGQGRSALSPSVRELVAVDAAVVVLQHVRVVDGTGAPARDDQTIIIAGEKIESIGNAASVAVPTGAKVLDERVLCESGGDA